MKQLLLHPILRPARLNGARFISFWQFVRHDIWIQRSELERLILSGGQKEISNEADSQSELLSRLAAHRKYPRVRYGGGRSGQPLLKIGL